MKIDWTTDKAGLIQGFSYHDYKLVRLKWLDSRYLRLTLSGSDGITIVEFGGLDTVTAQDILDGTIVSDIFVWPVKAVPETVWETIGGAWSVLLSGRTHRADKKSVAAQIMKRKPSAFLVQVLNSYGGAIAAVCEKIEVSTEAPVGKLVRHAHFRLSARHAVAIDFGRNGPLLDHVTTGRGECFASRFGEMVKS